MIKFYTQVRRGAILIIKALVDEAGSYTDIQVQQNLLITLFDDALSR